MYTLFVSLTIFASFLLVVVVLAQNSKGGGLQNNFGGSGASNLIGVKKTGDLLERLTWGLAITVMALVLATNFANPGGTGTRDELLDRARETQDAPTSAPALQQPANTDTTKK